MLRLFTGINRLRTFRYRSFQTAPGLLRLSTAGTAYHRGINIHTAPTNTPIHHIGASIHFFCNFSPLSPSFLPIRAIFHYLHALTLPSFLSIHSLFSVQSSCRYCSPPFLFYKININWLRIFGYICVKNCSDCWCDICNNFLEKKNIYDMFLKMC